MGHQLVIRLLQTVVSLIGMSLLIFVLVRASGDPVDLMRTSTSTDEEIANILPNILNPLLILATLSVGLIILVESALSYLGAGVPPPTATWGSMVSDGRGLIDTAWWMSFFPGLAIGLTVLSGNFLGDWLRDRLDPRLRQI